VEVEHANGDWLREPAEVDCLSVTEGTLPFRVQPILGRWFSRQTIPVSPETVLLTHGYWQSKFGGDPW